MPSQRNLSISPLASRTTVNTASTHTQLLPSKGMTPEIFKEFQQVIAMANETNRLVSGYQVAIDARFQPPLNLQK